MLVLGGGWIDYLKRIWSLDRARPCRGIEFCRAFDWDARAAEFPYCRFDWRTTCWCFGWVFDSTEACDYSRCQCLASSRLDGTCPGRLCSWWLFRPWCRSNLICCSCYSAARSTRRPCQVDSSFAACCPCCLRCLDRSSNSRRLI